MTPTFQKILLKAGLVIAVAVAVGFVGYQVFGNKLKAAKHDATAANDRADAAVQVSKTAWIVAGAALRAKTAAEAKADTAAKAAKHSKDALAVADARFASLGTAPDTCAKWIVGAIGARDLAVETAQHWKSAYDAQLEATAHLQVAIDTVKAADDSLIPATDSAVAASRRLVKATQHSFGHQFLMLIKPKINLNAVTIDATRHLGGPSVGLGWSISI